jgi:hypothetical protein
MAFAFPGDGSLDYFPCHYGKSKLMFRGPRQNIEVPYCAVLGGTETYGKFVPRPFVAMVEDISGHQMINLGCMNAGPDVYLNDPDILRIVSGAELAVVQVMGAQNLSNRFYAVHPRRNDRFLRASSWLQSLYRDVDFTEFHFTRHMVQTLQEVSADRFEVVVTELRENWVARMLDLLARIRAPALLLWMADHVPDGQGLVPNLYADPLLINAAMIETVRASAQAYLEVVLSPEAQSEGIQNKGFSPMERPAAEGVPGPKAHHEVAQAVADALRKLM